MHKLKNKILKTLLIGLFLFLGPFPAFAQSDATLDRIVSQIESLYPPIEGYVIAVEGSGLTLDLKR